MGLYTPSNILGRNTYTLDYVSFNISLEFLIIFRVSRKQREMYIGHSHLCVCLSVPRSIPTLLHGPGCNLGEW